MSIRFSAVPNGPDKWMQLMLKVANVIEEGRWGGPQKRISLIANKLKRFEIETVVIFPVSGSKIFRNELLELGVSFEQLPIHRLGKSPLTLLIFTLTFLFDVAVLYKALKKGHYDLVHVSGGAWQFKGVLAGRLAKIPVVWHLNDTSMPKILITLFRKLGQTVDAFFVAAKKTYEYYLNFPELKERCFYSMPAPVDTSIFNPNKVEAEKLLDKYERPIILTVCNLNPIKGVDILLKAARQLKDRGTAYTLLIIGPELTTQREYYKTLIDYIKNNSLEKNIFFLGPSNKIAELLKAGDIYVCASRAEASPMAVWEAMAMELPVISTDVGDVKYYLEHEQNGIIIPTENPGEMANALEKLISNTNLRILYGQSARRIIVNKLDIGVIAEMTSIAYKEIIQARVGNNRKHDV